MYAVPCRWLAPDIRRRAVESRPAAPGTSARRPPRGPAEHLMRMDDRRPQPYPATPAPPAARPSASSVIAIGVGLVVAPCSPRWSSRAARRSRDGAGAGARRPRLGEPPAGGRRPALLREVPEVAAERPVVLPARRLVRERLVAGRRRRGPASRSQPVRRPDGQQQPAAGRGERDEGHRAARGVARPCRRTGLRGDRGLAAGRRDRHADERREGFAHALAREADALRPTGACTTTTTARA